MEFAEICKMQILDDERRGFLVKFGSEGETYAQLIKDLVGLFGEVGEFSDLAKKVGLKLDQPRYDGPTLAESRDRLGKELGLSRSIESTFLSASIRDWFPTGSRTVDVVIFMLGAAGMDYIALL